MAKRVPPSDPAPEEELVVTVVRFKGSGETARKGIDAVSQALAAAFGSGAAIVRQMNGRKPAQLAAVTPAEEPIDTDAVETEAEEESTDAASPAPKAKKEPGKPKYSFIDDFNLAPDGVPSLIDFCTPKNATGEQDRYLVVCLWLQTHGGADPFTGNHVFTCFRALEWKPRLDVMQPVREMKSKKSWFSSPAMGKFRLTQPGITAAESVGK